MALFEIHADMSGIREALERIAAVLEREFPEPVLIDEPIEPRKAEVHWVDPTARYWAEVKEAIARGEDYTAWEYGPPRIGRRDRR